MLAVLLAFDAIHLNTDFKESNQPEPTYRRASECDIGSCWDLTKTVCLSEIAVYVELVPYCVAKHPLFIHIKNLG